MAEKIESGEKTEVSGAVGFDGNPIAAEYSVSRTGNTAIQALYGVNKTSKIKASMVTDEALGAKLIEAGYDGIQDLSKYYLDFYNGKYNLEAEKLEDLPDKVLREMFSGNCLRYKETTSELSQVGYNWFYNRLLSVIPESELDNYTDEDSEFTIGELMRNHTFEKYCQEAFGDMINNGDEAALEPFIMYLNFKYMDNAYQRMEFGYYVGLQFQQYDGSVKVEKVDSDGNIIKDTAEFLLYKFDEDGKKLYYTPNGFTADREAAAKLATEAGEFSVDYLLPGTTFYLEEISAPSGYVLGDQLVTFEILSNQQVLVRIMNAKEVIEDKKEEGSEGSDSKHHHKGGSNTPTVVAEYVVTPEGVIVPIQPVEKPVEEIEESAESFVPRTGDTTSAVPYVAVISAIVICGLVLFSRKSKTIE